MSYQRNEFQQAASARRTNLVEELWGFLQANRKWWLMPVLLAIVLLGLLVMLGSTAAAPFIYPLF